MRRWTVAIAISVGLGCDDHEVSPACSDPAQISVSACTGGESYGDEACAVLDDALRRGSTANDARAARITAPTEGQAVPAAQPFTVRWEPSTARRSPLGPGRPLRRHEASWRDELSRWLTLVPEAQAHCAPFTGRAYELRASVGTTVVLRRQQGLTQWTPSASEWQRLRDAARGGRAVELTLYTAEMSASQINPGSGPFTPTAPRRFTLTE